MDAQTTFLMIIFLIPLGVGVVTLVWVVYDELEKRFCAKREKEMDDECNPRREKKSRGGP